MLAEQETGSCNGDSWAGNAFREEAQIDASEEQTVAAVHNSGPGVDVKDEV